MNACLHERNCIERRNESLRGNREEGPPSEKRQRRATKAPLNLSRKDETRFSCKDSGGSAAVALLLPPHISLLRKCGSSHGTASASGHSALRTERAEVECVRGVYLQGQQKCQTHNVTLFSEETLRKCYPGIY